MSWIGLWVLLSNVKSPRGLLKLTSSSAFTNLSLSDVSPPSVFSASSSARMPSYCCTAKTSGSSGYDFWKSATNFLFSALSSSTAQNREVIAPFARSLTSLRTSCSVRKPAPYILYPAAGRPSEFQLLMKPIASAPEKKEYTFFVGWFLICVTKGAKSGLLSGGATLPVTVPPFLVIPVVKSAADSVPKP